jgi:hypothetical protein
MKQIITTTLTAAALFISCVSFSQTALILGVGGGAALSKIKGTGDLAPGDYDVSRILRYQGGVEAGMQFGGFSILTGLRFQQRGTKQSVTRDDPNGNFWVFSDGSTDVGSLDIGIKFNQLSIPLLLGYQMGGGDLKFNIALGPQFNIGMGQVTETNDYDLLQKGMIMNEYMNNFGTRADERFKPMHISFVFRPGISYDISPDGSLTLNFIFESGGDMLNRSYLVADSNGARKVQGSAKTRATALEIGYRHRINFRMGVKY